MGGEGQASLCLETCGGGGGGGDGLEGVEEEEGMDGGHAFPINLISINIPTL